MDACGFIDSCLQNDTSPGQELALHSHFHISRDLSFQSIFILPPISGNKQTGEQCWNEEPEILAENSGSYSGWKNTKAK